MLKIVWWEGDAHFNIPINTYYFECEQISVKKKKETCNFLIKILSLNYYLFKLILIFSRHAILMYYEKLDFIIFNTICMHIET